MPNTYFFHHPSNNHPHFYPASMFRAPFILLFLGCFACPALSDARATEVALMCTNKTASMPESQTFVANFLAAMETISPLIARQRYGAVVNGTGNAVVYAFGECLKDLSKSDCDVCFAQCKTQILRCLPFQKGTRGGSNFFDGCYLRYDDHNFFNQSLSDQDKTVCSKNDFGGNRTIYKANTLELVRNLSVEALRNDGFIVGFVNQTNVTVYGLAQCWEFVNESACEQCLADAVTEIGSCVPKEEGRVLNAGCYLRYSTQKFYNNSTISEPGRNQGRRVAIIAAALSAGLASLLIVATVAFFARKNILKKRRERRQLGALLDTVNKSKLNMSYETLERATNYFDDSNKLGQGGSGSVYKGILPDGTTVAIKRLSFNTTQWVDHFFNEVNLISGIHHKNLVKLLGCSMTGPESLLVYEYVPNHSLHDHFSVGLVKRNAQPLTWEARSKIILGIAEGLSYLHEESQLRIIHRDIKLSNVLLDVDFTPKIADFGLARLFPEDKTHISTAIAGTLGYMAPEYIVRGKLTEKADVYSFGVLVIEIVSGKRNSSFVLNSSSILQMVWSLYRSDKLCDIVDPTLEGNYQAEEACRLLKIGLLCAQASAELRPSMSAVVKMITSNDEIPQPTQPPFLVSTSEEFSTPTTPYKLEPGSHSQSSGNSNSMTNSLLQPR